MSFLFMYLPTKPGFVILKPFAIPYLAVTWAMSSNSSSCSETITELSRLVHQSHMNSAQNSVYQTPRHFWRSWLLQRRPPPLEKQLQHSVTPCKTGSPAISCYFILLCCFLSWHISHLWYLLMPREQGLKPLLKMQRKEVTDFFWSSPQPPQMVGLSLPLICKLLGQEIWRHRWDKRPFPEQIHSW